MINPKVPEELLNLRQSNIIDHSRISYEKIEDNFYGIEQHLEICLLNCKNSLLIEKKYELLSQTYPEFLEKVEKAKEIIEYLFTLLGDKRKFREIGIEKYNDFKILWGELDRCYFVT